MKQDAKDGRALLKHLVNQEPGGSTTSGYRLNHHCPLAGLSEESRCKLAESWIIRNDFAVPCNGANGTIRLTSKGVSEVLDKKPWWKRPVGFFALEAWKVVLGLIIIGLATYFGLR